ncbi:MAG TPA: PrgI family protein [bacterium]|nr:PrgI family protein [bacterium]
MKQFVVPQFIDVEDKILGPITVRQFILIVVGGIIEILTLKFGDVAFFIFVTVLVAPTILLFGFIKVYGYPFHSFLINVATSLKKPQLRVWNKNSSQEVVKEQEDKKIEETIPVKKPLVSSRLAELSLMVDTHGKYKGEEE